MLVTDPPPRGTDGQLQQGTDENASPGDSDYCRRLLEKFASIIGGCDPEAIRRAQKLAHAASGGPRGGSLEDPSVLHHAQLHDEEADGERDVGDVQEVADSRGVLPRGSYRTGRIDQEPGIQEQEDRAPPEVHSGVPGTVGDFAKFVLPAIKPIGRRVFSSLIAQQLVSVQPMSVPSGGVFYQNYTYGSDIELRIFFDDQPDRPGGPEWRGDQKAARDR